MTPRDDKNQIDYKTPQNSTLFIYYMNIQNFLSNQLYNRSAAKCKQTERPSLLQRLQRIRTGLWAWPINARYNWVDLFRSVQFSLCPVNEAFPAQKWAMKSDFGRAL